jgi:hypothetical protein
MDASQRCFYDFEANEKAQAPAEARSFHSREIFRRESFAAKCRIVAPAVLFCCFGSGRPGVSGGLDQAVRPVVWCFPLCRGHRTRGLHGWSGRWQHDFCALASAAFGVLLYRPALTASEMADTEDVVFFKEGISATIASWKRGRRIFPQDRLPRDFP